METIFMNTENRKRNDPRKFFLNFVTDIRFKKINMSLSKYICLLHAEKYKKTVQRQ